MKKPHYHTTLLQASTDAKHGARTLLQIAVQASILNSQLFGTTRSLVLVGSLSSLSSLQKHPGKVDLSHNWHWIIHRGGGV